MKYGEYFRTVPEWVSDTVYRRLEGLPDWVRDAIVDSLDLESIATGLEFAYMRVNKLEFTDSIPDLQAVWDSLKGLE